MRVPSAPPLRAAGQIHADNHSMTTIGAQSPTQTRSPLESEQRRQVGEEAVRAQAVRPLDPSVVQATADVQQTRGEQARPVTGAPSTSTRSAPALPGAPGAPSPRAALSTLTSKQVIEAAQTPTGQEALRQAHSRPQERLQTPAQAITARSPREHATEFARGLKDGVKDTVGGLVETAKLAARFATDSTFRSDVVRGVAELREAMRSPEGRALVGRALGDGGDSIVAEISRNPAYAAGFVAGSLVTGGPVTKAISAASKLGAAGRLVDKGRQLVAGHGRAIAAGGVVAGGAVLGGTQLGRDAVRTGAEAPFATINGVGLMLSGRGRILGAAGREHLKEQAAAQRPPPPPSPVPDLLPVDGSSHWLYAP